MKNAGAGAWTPMIIFFLIIFSSTINAQQGTLTKRPNVPINSNCNGYLEYLPYNYANTTQKYPLLIYINGIGSTGDGSLTALDNLFSGGGYPQEQQRDGIWPDVFTVNGQSHQLLVIIPQFVESMWNRFPTPGEVNDVINYTIQNYRIDTTRIYLAGSSQGGKPVWEYPGTNSAYAKRIAAIAPFGAVSIPFPETANRIKNGKVAVWAFHNQYDDLVPVSFTQDYITWINEPPAPAVEAKATIFNAAGHICWWAPLMRIYTEGGLNVYQWMLQFQKLPSTVYAGDDQEIALLASSVQLNGTGVGPNGTAASYLWEKMTGPAGGIISNSSILNPSVTNLTEGTHSFRLTITDNAGGTYSDEVAIVVNPAFQRIEAENYTAMSGIQTAASPDLGGSTIVGWTDLGDWMDYSVTVPTTGDYIVRFRVGSFYEPSFVVRNSAGQVLDTVKVYNTGSWDNFITLTHTLHLVAGTQTIRIESIHTDGWNINWFEIENMAAEAGALPVNFTLFNAQCLNGQVNLTWKTAAEQNSLNFQVEKSTNGRDWTLLTTIPAAGQSSGERSYTFRDLSVASNSFYRVMQVDQDGRKTYTSILRNACRNGSLFSVYPNPVVDKASVSIELERETKLNFSIADSKGAVVRQVQRILPSGTSQVNIDMGRLPSGSYTLFANWNGMVRSVKVLKR